MIDTLPPHTKLERQVERIHQLLEVEGAAVTWNDRIPDPDNPSQARQIDVTIRRDDTLTIVECRLHKNPQDVTWIEELMGRRTSLKADAVIAVSTSGFTKTAQEKAAAHGIHLRDFASLSDEEIQNWGRKRTLTVSFVEFSQVTLTMNLGEPPQATRPILTGLDGQPVNPMMWRLLYQSIMHQLDRDKWSGVPITMDGEIKAKVLVNGKPPLSIHLYAKIKRINQKVALSSVFEYADPIRSKGHAEVGRFDLGGSEIIENFDDVAVTVDVSTILVPDGCCFETVTVDAGRVVNARVNVIGGLEAMNSRIPIQVRYRFPRPPSGGGADSGS